MIRTSDEQAGLLAAMRRFPNDRDEIEALMDRNENFRDMCEELGLAEAALARIDLVSQSCRESRTLECKGWIDRLTMEIAEAIRNRNVIPIEKPGRSKR